MRDKPVVYWVSTPTEVEYDMYMLSRLTTKIDLRICTVGTPTVVHPYGVNIAFLPYDGSYVEPGRDMSGECQRALYNRIAKENPDLVIKKTGWTAFNSKQISLFPSVMKAAGVKHCLWTSEQGCLRDWQLEIAKNYDWVAVNNLSDYDYYGRVWKFKKLSYMPFGCVPQFHKKVETKKVALICSYSNPRIDIPVKLASFSRLVGGLIDIYSPQDLALYGKPEWYPGIFSKFYRGEWPYVQFSEINSSSDIVLGVTANTETGGYGTKLAKMLSCGAFVLWDYTKGMERDFNNRVHLVWSNSARETQSLVKYYLEHPDERKKIAECGQKYAHENLSWETNILKLLKEAS